MRLVQYIHDHAPYILRMEYKYPDGTIHDRPVWDNPEYLASDDYQNIWKNRPWDNAE